MSSGPHAGDLAARAEGIAQTAAGPMADEVDRDARFPHEAIAAVREDGMLGALIPTALGGEGAALADVAASITELARGCASTGMVVAMHHIQVACIVRHGGTPTLADYLRRVVGDALLLASATTEAGIGGDVRSSSCAVEHDGAGRFTLDKVAPVISYGAHADGILATARRDPSSPANDQVLVLCEPPDLTLDPIGEWDTLGFRGTCSLGFRLHAEGPDDHVLPEPFGDISAQTMLPVSHIVWSSVWLGIATEAVDRAHRYVRAEARKTPGVTPPSALRLAELMTLFQQMEALVRESASSFDELAGDRDALASLGFAIRMNALKVSSSTLVVEIVQRAMTICGMAGYRLDSPFTLGRLLRDAHGAALMVNNDRILGNNAQMLLVHKGG
jgi:acyl-CoA dehydrogenase